VGEAGAIGWIALPPDDGVARVGPNAVIRVAEALAEAQGEAVARAVFARAGLLGWLDQPPAAMVPEADVAALHRALVETLSEPEARGIAASAGRRTAAYLLANRIPRPVQAVLSLLPGGPSSRILLKAISRHAWTFVGSGTFSVTYGNPAVVTITGGPLRAAGAAAPGVAAYYAATFEALFRALVSPRSSVTALRRATEASAACAFALAW